MTIIDAPKPSKSIGEELDYVTRRAFIPRLFEEIYKGIPWKPAPWYRRWWYAVERLYWRCRAAWSVLTGKEEL